MASALLRASHRGHSRHNLGRAHLSADRRNAKIAPVGGRQITASASRVEIHWSGRQPRTGKRRLLSSEPADQARPSLHRFLGNTSTLIGDVVSPSSTVGGVLFQTRIRSQLSNWEAQPGSRDLSWFSYWQGILNRDLSRIPNLSVIEEGENARIAKSIGTLFADTLIPPDLRRARWGFKEIWNGGDSFNYSWKTFTDAFPSAQYVQCVRNPYAFANSYFANNQKTAISG
jgi:hypothetical protein